MGSKDILCKSKIFEDTIREVKCMLLKFGGESGTRKEMFIQNKFRCRVSSCRFVSLNDLILKL